MTKFTYLAAAAVVTSLAIGPAMAKDAVSHSNKPSVKVHQAAKQARAPTWRNDRAADVTYDRGFDPRQNYDRGYDNGGFWPGAVAAGIVGGAVNSAEAIANAPFRDTYAYDNSYGYDSSYDDSYAAAPVYRSNWDNGWNTYDGSWNNGWAGQTYGQRNGFVCTPGSLYTNDNGRTQLCQ